MGRKKPNRKMKAIPFRILDHNGSSLIIKYNAITINGKIEDAAWALANEILSLTKNTTPNQAFDWTILDCLRVDVAEGIVSISLVRDNAISSELWAVLKKDVEKICNNLKAFM